MWRCVLRPAQDALSDLLETESSAFVHWGVETGPIALRLPLVAQDRGTEMIKIEL